MEECKYFDEHLKTIRQYISCLYGIDGCASGGLLHILLDDDNCDNDDILYCLKECIQHPEREESKIGHLICEEYLKLGMEQRRLLTTCYIGNWRCSNRGKCEQCFITCGDECL